MLRRQKTFKQIVNCLNILNLKTRIGRQWTEKSIHGLVRRGSVGYLRGPYKVYPSSSPVAKNRRVEGKPYAWAISRPDAIVMKDLLIATWADKIKLEKILGVHLNTVSRWLKDFLRYNPFLKAWAKGLRGFKSVFSRQETIFTEHFAKYGTEVADAYHIDTLKALIEFSKVDSDSGWARNNMEYRLKMILEKGQKVQDERIVVYFSKSVPWVIKNHYQKRTPVFIVELNQEIARLNKMPLAEYLSTVKLEDNPPLIWPAPEKDYKNRTWSIKYPWYKDANVIERVTEVLLNRITKYGEKANYANTLQRGLKVNPDEGVFIGVLVDRALYDLMQNLAKAGKIKSRPFGKDGKKRNPSEVLLGSAMVNPDYSGLFDLRPLTIGYGVNYPSQELGEKEYAWLLLFAAAEYENSIPGKIISAGQIRDWVEGLKRLGKVLHKQENFFATDFTTGKYPETAGESYHKYTIKAVMDYLGKENEHTISTLLRIILINGRQVPKDKIGRAHV
jgi:hypothetical protein